MQGLYSGFGIGDDPKKPSKRAVQEAEAFAKNFAMRKIPMIGSNAHTGGLVPQFIDSATGQQYMPDQLRLPPNTITDIRKVPSYVRAEDIVVGNDNIPYFEDQSTGDMTPIHPDILRSSRFNPNRGQYDKSVAKK
jgi:hypothetical protein